MGSDVECDLIDFASRKRQIRAWVDELPDGIYNQVWDALHNGTVGKYMAAKWLRGLGYEEATPSKVVGVLDRERRP